MIQQLIQLAEGNFNNVKLDEWFEYMHEYGQYQTAIAMTIQGCSKQINLDMFLLIFMYAKKYYYKTTDSTSTNDIIINNYCEEFLKDLIIISRTQPQYKHIIHELSNFPNSIIRLYYCAYINHKEFFDDNSPRVRKVAKIIDNFYNQKLTEIFKNHDYDKLEFLTAAIKYGAIQMISLTTPTKNDELTSIKFKSSLFNWNDKSINPNIMNFDVDILYTIPNKQILASIILDWIKNEKISFVEDMTPECFKEESEKKLKRTLKPSNPKILTSDTNQ